MEQKQAPRFQPEPCQAVSCQTRIPKVPMGCRARPGWQHCLTQPSILCSLLGRLLLISQQIRSLSDCFSGLGKCWSPEYPAVPLVSKCCVVGTTQQIKQCSKFGEQGMAIPYLPSPPSPVSRVCFIPSVEPLIFPVRIHPVTLPLTIF